MCYCKLGAPGRLPISSDVALPWCDVRQRLALFWRPGVSSEACHGFASPFRKTSRRLLALSNFYRDDFQASSGFLAFRWAGSAFAGTTSGPLLAIPRFCWAASGVIAFPSRRRLASRIVFKWRLTFSTFTWVRSPCLVFASGHAGPRKKSPPRTAGRGIFFFSPRTSGAPFLLPPAKSPLRCTVRGLSCGPPHVVGRGGA